MPSQSEIALLLGAISLLGQIVNAWLKSKTRAELLEMQRDLLEKVDRTYVRKELCDSRRPTCVVAREVRGDVAG